MHGLSFGYKLSSLVTCANWERSSSFSAFNALRVREFESLDSSCKVQRILLGNSVYFGSTFSRLLRERLCPFLIGEVLN